MSTHLPASVLIQYCRIFDKARAELAKCATGETYAYASDPAQISPQDGATVALNTRKGKIMFEKPTFVEHDAAIAMADARQAIKRTVVTEDWGWCNVVYAERPGYVIGMNSEGLFYRKVDESLEGTWRANVLDAPYTVRMP